MNTFVVKISSQLTDNLAPFANAIIEAIRQGNRVVVVSGGAVKRGLDILQLNIAKATTLDMQAAAGIGQIELMNDWQFHCGMGVAQFLLTHHDFDDRANNIREVIERAIEMGMLPIANSPDTVTSEETRLTADISENSGVASRLAVILEAGKLVMLGTEDYIYDADPRKYADARPILKVTDLSDEFLAQFPAEEPQDGSFGGIRALVEACLYAANRGVKVIVTSGLEPENLSRILRGEEFGTVFRPATT